MKEKKWTKPGGSSSGLRNAFDLLPAELDFSLKKTAHGVFLLVNIASQDAILLVGDDSYVIDSWEKIAQFLLRITVFGD